MLDTHEQIGSGVGERTQMLPHSDSLKRRGNTLSMSVSITHASLSSMVEHAWKAHMVAKELRVAKMIQNYHKEEE